MRNGEISPHPLQSDTFFYSMFYCHVDSITDIVKTTHNVQIGNPKHIQPQGFQIGRTLMVVLDFRRLTVLGAIQLHHQLRPMAIEIHNVVANNVLSSELHRVSSQEPIPEKIFFLGSVFPQALCVDF
jgi:hypothetical protein